MLILQHLPVTWLLMILLFPHHIWGCFETCESEAGAQAPQGATPKGCQDLLLSWPIELLPFPCESLSASLFMFLSLSASLSTFSPPPYEARHNLINKFSCRQMIGKARQILPAQFGKLHEIRKQTGWSEGRACSQWEQTIALIILLHFCPWFSSLLIWYTTIIFLFDHFSIKVLIVFYSD